MQCEFKVNLAWMSHLKPQFQSYALLIKPDSAKSSWSLIMIIVRSYLWSVLLFLKTRDILFSHKSRSDMLFAIIMMLSWLKAKMWTGLDLRCMCLTLRFFKSWHQNLPQDFVNLWISREYIEKTTQPNPLLRRVGYQQAACILISS